MNWYSAFIRPLLFRLDPETAHQRTVEFCRRAGMIPGVPSLARRLLEYRHPALACEVAGLSFGSPIGLAAGWDKSGNALPMVQALGFGFAEMGSVSCRPSEGNPRPRLFRLPEQEAIVVNYGLPNDGAEIVARRLAAVARRIPLGVNLVKTNDGPDAPACEEEEILSDYVESASRLHDHADYLMLNLSCPNAGDGREFFVQPGTIARLLERLSSLRMNCPVFLKVAPVDDPAAHDRLLAESDAYPFVKGFCFNLPSGKPNTLVWNPPPEKLGDMPGAVAGRPVAALIDRCIAGLYARLDPQRHVIIGGGGVFTADDAYRKIRLGASLVQLYTVLVYAGPGVVKVIQRGLVELLTRDGFRTVGEAVGQSLRD